MAQFLVISACGHKTAKQGPTQTMSRPFRLEFPNALYHVTSREDRREKILKMMMAV